MPEVKEVIERVSDERLAEHVSVGIGYYHAFKTLSDIETMSVVKELQRARTLLQERDELLEALRPFAEAWSEIERIYAKHGVSCEPADEVLVRSWQFTHGEYRRAARALSNKEAK